MAQSIRFLEIEEARAVLADTSYFSALGPEECAIKTNGRVRSGGRRSRRRLTRELYKQEVLAWSRDERNVIGQAVMRIRDELGTSCPVLAGLDWRLAKLSDGVEGLPFTLGETIFLPQSWVARFCQDLNEGRWNGAFAILLEEQFHVFQRIRPELFRSLYQDWGFVRVESNRIKGVSRIPLITNPDGIERWAWTGLVDRSWDVLVPRNLSAWGLRSSEKHGKIMVSEDGKQTQWLLPVTIADPSAVSLAQPGNPMLIPLRVDSRSVRVAGPPTPAGASEAFVAVFQATPRRDHPNEMAAYFFVTVVTWEAEGRDLPPVFRVFKTWMRDTLCVNDTHCTGPLKWSSENGPRTRRRSRW